MNKDVEFINKIKEKILSGGLITKKEAETLYLKDFDSLMNAADEIRERFCGKDFELCTIVNGKSGRCSEDCKYCSQSIYHNADIDEYELLDSEYFLDNAVSNFKKGIHGFSIVTSGRNLTFSEVEKLCVTYKKIKEKCKIKLCASNGLLSYEQLKKLKNSGVDRYHCNLETSRSFFPNICTTHSFEEKVNVIKNAQKAGLGICSGGIIGLGEKIEDRIDMAFSLRHLGVKSIPINILNPIKGTKMENQKVLEEEEIIRTIAIMRFILPKAQIRLAGGRSLLNDSGCMALKSGINAMITGDMLTTTGTKTDEDFALVKSMGFKV